MQTAFAARCWKEIEIFPQGKRGFFVVQRGQVEYNHLNKSGYEIPEIIGIRQ